MSHSNACLHSAQCELRFDTNLICGHCIKQLCYIVFLDWVCQGLWFGMHYMAPLLQLSPNPNWTQLCAKCPCYVPWPLIWRAWCTCSHTLDFSLKMADKYMHKLCIAHAMQCTDQCDFCINVNDLCVYFQILSICSTASTVTSVRFCVVLLTTSVVQGVLQTVSEAINSLICGDSTDMTANSKQSVNES